MAVNRCSPVADRCANCIAKYPWLGNDGAAVGAMVDAAASDPSYSHLSTASGNEIAGMTSQITEGFRRTDLFGPVAGGLLMIASGICERDI